MSGLYAILHGPSAGRRELAEQRWGDDEYSPQRVGIKDNWQQVAAGDGNSLAINRDGELYSWGSNYAGRLGLGRRGPAKVSLPN